MKTQNNPTERSSRNKEKDLSQHVKAINYIMLLLSESYPLQFKQAYPTPEDRARAQSVWLQVLHRYPAERVKRSPEIVLKQGRKFLPSLGDIIETCRYSYEDLGLKHSLAAYLEAARYCGQAKQHQWSHLAIYLAAKRVSLFLIKTESKEWIYPQFKSYYQDICNQLRDGRTIEGLDKILESYEESSIIPSIERQFNQEMGTLMTDQGINPSAGKQAFDEALQWLK